MRNITSVARVVLGGYLAVHGAQKLFGAFGGPGLEGTAKGFESIGLTPAKEMAMLAGASELGGGILTATGIADPLGPIALAGVMTVATTVHRKAGPMAANGGFELPLTNLALAAVLIAAGPAGHRFGVRLPKLATAVVATGAIALTGISVAKHLNHTRNAAANAPAATDIDGDGPS
jgi:putative oxidoreductase